MQRFLSESGSGSAWVALSFDVASAHKLIRVKPEEQGLGCFALGNDFFVYRSCYFGAKYSAYWWSRVGAWLVRMLHRFLWISHACFLYVDDGLVLVPKDVAPLLASACLAFLTALGVPLSWKKVKLGDELVWIGWRFCFSSGYIQLPDDKSQKILEALSPFCTSGQKVDRKTVERLIGLLLWYPGGAVHLRPWLQALYHLLYKPLCVFRSVTPHQFEVLRQLLDTKLALTGHMECCDLQQGWVLHAVANCAVSSLGADALVSPRLKRGQVDCVFYNYSSVSVRTNLASMWACKLFFIMLWLSISRRIVHTLRSRCICNHISCWCGWLVGAYCRECAPRSSFLVQHFFGQVELAGMAHLCEASILHSFIRSSGAAFALARACAWDQVSGSSCVAYEAVVRQCCRGGIDAEDAIIEGTSCFCVTGHQLSCSGTRCAAHLCTLRGRAQWLGG